jgi:hypothetical protein
VTVPERLSRQLATGAEPLGRWLLEVREKLLRGEKNGLTENVLASCRLIGVQRFNPWEAKNPRF